MNCKYKRLGNDDKGNTENLLKSYLSKLRY